MAALTWRNVDAPDLSRAIQTLSDGNANLQRAFAGAGTALQDWGRNVRDTNTGNAELALAKFGTNADLQAAIQQGLLDPNALRETYGNVDAGALARYSNDLATSLQNREVAQQGIDRTNNQIQFGSQLAGALVDAGNGNMTTLEALRNNPNIRGDVLMQAAPDIQAASAAFQTRAEQQRSNRANEGIAGQNAATNRLNVQAEIDARNRAWQAGALQRQVSDQQNQATLDANANLQAGAKAFDPNSNRLPAEQREVLNRSLVNAPPAEREAKLKGFDASVGAFMNPTDPTQALAQQALAPDLQAVSNLNSGLKSIVNASAGQANAWNNTIQVSTDSNVKSIPDAVAGLKAMGLDTTDRKVNDFVQQAVGMGATPAEALAIASGSGRGSYTSIIDGKTTLDGAAALQGVRDYMKYKTSTEGIKTRQSVADQTQKIDTLSNAVSTLLQRQQYYVAQKRPDRAQALQGDIDKAKAQLSAYAGLVNQTNPVQAAPTAASIGAGWRPSWQ